MNLYFSVNADEDKVSLFFHDGVKSAVVQFFFGEVEKNSIETLPSLLRGKAKILELSLKELERESVKGGGK